jgi:hypothetical protein
MMSQDLVEFNCSCNSHDTSHQPAGSAGPRRISHEDLAALRRISQDLVVDVWSRGLELKRAVMGHISQGKLVLAIGTESRYIAS